jgi:chromodomain-helicase-DNA-binding protein 1
LYTHTRADDVLEWDEGAAAETSNASDTIDKVLWHRVGKKGAVGPATTVYNVEDKGDPNDGHDPSVGPSERHYLIKWTGWAYIHNTWESYESLTSNNVNGMKKLDNYIKTMKQRERWLRTADRQSRDYFEIEQKMVEELVDSYKVPARVVGMGLLIVSTTNVL